VGAFAKLWKATVSFVMSVCPSVHTHVTTRLPLEEFLQNSIFVFQKSINKNSIFLKI